MKSSMWSRRVAVCVAAVIAGVVIVPWIHAAPKVGVVLKARGGFWAAAEHGARTAAAEAGAEIVARSPQSESDIAAQVRVFNALVEEGCGAMVLAPSGTEALIEPVEAAMARGVKVVIIDTRLARDVAPVFVGTDQVEAGRAAGRLLASLVGPADVVGVLRHNRTSGATADREAGALEALRALRPGLVIYDDVYSSEERGMETVQAGVLLDRISGASGILASGTPGTTAMLKVLRDRGLAGSVRFVGFGYNINRVVDEALEQGHLDGWVAQLPVEMGARGMRAAVALVRGEPVEPVQHTAFVVVTRDNRRDPAVLAQVAP